jgi:hypothetical protein
MKHHVQVRPGVDAMPSAALLGHRLLHALRLFRHLSVSSHQMF